MAVDAKGALYTSEMAYWLPKFQYPSRGKRFDLRFCPDGALVDQATGIEAMKPPATPRSAEEGGGLGWVPPEERAARLEGLEGPASSARPEGSAGGGLAEWAREAAATVVPPEPPRLTLSGLDIDFPRRQGQRLVARVLVTLPALPTLPTTAGLQVEPEKKEAPGAASDPPRARLLVAGRIEVAGRTFEEFRVRYEVPPPADGTPLALLLERQLRPARSFLLRLSVRDEAGGAEAALAHGFRVPEEPVARFAPAAVAAAAPGAPVGIGAPSGPDRLVLLPPPTEDLVLGVWRAEAVVTGDRIAKLVFAVDGEPPAHALRAAVLGRGAPRPPAARAGGARRGLRPGGGAGRRRRGGAQPAPRRLQGAHRRAPAGRPPHGPGAGAGRGRGAGGAAGRGGRGEGRRRVGGDPRESPWQHEVQVPPGDGIAYLTFAARLDDGSRAEDVRFLRAPADLEEVNVDLVEVYATVLDGGDRPVHGLTAADFEVLEAGRRQAIAQFEAVENIPLSLGVAIDTSFSMLRSLPEAKRAAAGFLRHLIRPGDRCFALAFSSRPVLLIPPVDDVEAVSRTVEGLGAYGSTALYDALLTSLYTFRGQPGQSALVLLSDGDDTASAGRWEDVREYARRSGVAIYAIRLGESERGGRAKLAELAEVSGGRLFHIDRAEELERVYAEIERELRSRYLLAYAADRPAGEGGYRQVEVRVKKRGLKTRTARSIYF